MSADAVAQTIQAVIAPTVLISGCTLIQNAILIRYSGIGDRLRALVRERIDLLEKYDISEAVYADALYVIDQQLLVLSRRHLLMQNTALILYSAIVCFLLSMFAIALAKAFYPTVFSHAAIVLFLMGTATLFMGVMVAAAEIRISHKAVRAEIRWAMSLTHPTEMDEGLGRQPSSNWSGKPMGSPQPPLSPP
ncbi:MAG: DUF2721 domain-containing protein [Kovacikia sp.]